MSPNTTQSPPLANRIALDTNAPLSPTEQEHLALLRQMARLQKQMSQLVHGYEAQLRRWQQQLMLQSIRLMLERTRGNWGLLRTHSDAGQLADPRVLGSVAAAEADALICRTGCVMDVQHWRDGDLCRLSGRSCVVESSVARKI